MAFDRWPNGQNFTIFFDTVGMAPPVNKQINNISDAIT
jgi:hypothetical protein